MEAPLLTQSSNSSTLPDFIKSKIVCETFHFVELNLLKLKRFNQIVILLHLSSEDGIFQQKLLLQKSQVNLISLF